ncbi:hypothetical protein [Hymenobacter convexus]|uniref:hypothetical protein n=1 Tax=Hymenobacter sp. CA1UV-4 TaxID=3063782 RepID=UPI0027127F63|nr:hypothetical protein [Hymenobacter sp. CA1UV-4]MDO7850053.1 hypothetical protein [Hymenobacter sp. CA1UV-4]
MSKATRWKTVFFVVFSFSWLAGAGPLRAQTWQWASSVVMGSSNDASMATAAAVDEGGNTVVTGYFHGTANFGAISLVSNGGTDLFIAKLSPAGNWVSAVRVGGNGSVIPHALAIDGEGAVLVAGSYTGNVNFGSFTLTNVTSSTSSPDKVFVARLNSSGIWTMATAPQVSGVATALALDPLGNAVVAGYYAGTATFGTTTLPNANTSFGGASADAFVATLNPAGTWTTAVRAGGPNYDTVRALAIDAAGNVTVAGYFQGSATFGPITITAGTSSNVDLFVARLSAAGTWTQAVGAGGSGSDSADALALDGAGNAVVGGVFFGTTAFGATTLTSAGGVDVFVARLTPAGTWAQATRAGAAGDDGVSALAVDATNNATVVGFFAGNVGFGPSVLTSTQLGDVFAATLSPAGTWTQAVRGGGPGDDQVAAVALKAGSATLVGTFQQSATFGSITVLSNTIGNRSSFVARLSGLATAARPAAGIATFTLSPNPARGLVRADWTAPLDASARLLLFDAMGREVARQPLAARTSSAYLDITGLAPGLYVVRCGAATSRLQVE